MELKKGKFDNISLKEYHALPGWSKTRLDLIHRSPAHMVYAMENPKDSTPAMAFGSALHCAVLTPAIYHEQYAIAPECDKRTKDGKNIFAEFEEKNHGKDIISAIQAGQIEQMKQAIFAHPLASQLLQNGEAEQSFFWIDKTTGLQCKARPDYLRYDEICIDLKTTEDATFKAFQRSFYNYRYHVQGAFFIDGIFQATQMQCSDFVIIAIEKEPPFGIMVYRFDDLSIDTGRITYEDDLKIAKAWKEKPESFQIVYPISKEPIELSLPGWAD
jgi:exodeoxyribonuclease VIII